MTTISEHERAQLRAYLLSEYNHPFAGWDFSYLENRRVVNPTPLSWDYEEAVRARLPHVHSLLDMGTGGGEFLSNLTPLPADTCATEGYPPNIPIAQARLEPLGITVAAISDDLQLPFAANRFDLIINRHESYSPQELYRVLKRRGTFITQQVGGQNMIGLNRILGGPEPAFGMPGWTLEHAVQQLRDQTGFEIVTELEAFPEARFYDVGAIVYYLKVIPWQIPDFSVEKYLDALIAVHQTIQREGYIAINEHRFYIEAISQ